MSTVFRLVFRAAALALGLVLAVGFSVLFAALLAGWGLRLGWARLTGKPVAPFAMRFRRPAGFAGFGRRSGEEPADAAVRPFRPQDAVPLRARGGEVTDVAVK
jgi:hypothetical protein